MTPQKLEEFEQTLREGIQKAKGLSIRSGAFGICDSAIGTWMPYQDCVCPIGAALIGKPCPTLGGTISDRVARTLGLKNSEIQAFVHGFDRNPAFHAKWNSTDDQNLYDLGVKFRQELCPPPPAVPFVT